MHSVESDVMPSTSPGWGDAPMVKRNCSRGMLPSTWMGRELRLAYLGVDGKPVETSGTLLDWCGTGPVFNLAGGRTVVCWDRLITLELASS